MCWGPHSWSWRAAGCAGVLSPGPGEPQGVLGSSLLVLESRRVCWGPHSWSWRAAGCAEVLTPGPGEPQGVLGSSVLVLESRRVCWGPQSWSWRATGCAGFLPSQHLIDQRKQLITQLTHLTCFLLNRLSISKQKCKPAHPAALPK